MIFYIRLHIKNQKMMAMIINVMYYELYTVVGLGVLLLGGTWDLVTTDSRPYNPTYNWGDLCKATWGDYKWWCKARIKW